MVSLVLVEDFRLPCWMLFNPSKPTCSTGDLFYSGHLIFLPDLLAFAYLAQCRCDPAGTPRYSTNIFKNNQESVNFGKISSATATTHSSCQTLEMELWHRSARTLGFGVDNDEDVPDDIV